MGHSGLPCTARSDQCQELPRPDIERYVSQNGASSLIFERNIPKGDVPMDSRKSYGIVSVFCSNETFLKATCPWTLERATASSASSISGLRSNHANILWNGAKEPITLTFRLARLDTCAVNIADSAMKAVTVPRLNSPSITLAPPYKYMIAEATIGKITRTMWVPCTVKVCHTGQPQ